MQADRGGGRRERGRTPAPGDLQRTFRTSEPTGRWCVNQADDTYDSSHPPTADTIGGRLSRLSPPTPEVGI